MKVVIEDIPKGLVYLSMPFNDKDSGVMYRRMVQFWKTAGELISAGVHVVSPMSMEPTLRYSDMTTNWESWANYANALIAASEEVWVMQLDGWDKSSGVAGEILYAREHGKQVRFLEFGK